MRARSPACTAACIIGLFIGIESIALAQTATRYPVRPVRMIVPFGPGGAGDFVARVLQPAMSDALGQQVIVENRAGASGNVGVEVAINATPDGHVFLLGNIGAIAINPNAIPGTTIRPLRDLVAVTQVVDVPGSLIVHPSITATTVSELTAHLKARSGQINFGSSGGAGQNRLDTELFMQQTGTRMVHVPYKGGAGQAVTALLGNEVQLLMVTFSSAVNHVKAGRLRMIGVIAPERLPVMPEMPTLREQGLKTMVNGSWQGIYLPRKTPGDIVAKLFDSTVSAVRQPEVARRLADGGVTPMVSASPKAFMEFTAAETERFGRLIRDAKLDLE
jgi:tripartite-type tricarboxylate transporter receptor subunit TctC